MPEMLKRQAGVLSASSMAGAQECPEEESRRGVFEGSRKSEAVGGNIKEKGIRGIKLHNS